MSHSAGTTENFQGSSNKVTPFFARLYAVMSPYMNEKSRRLMVGAEAYFRGHGGVNAVAWETDVNRATVYRGRQEIAGQIKIADKIRHSGGGRKDTWETDPTFLDDLKRLVDPETRADPMSQLRWCSKSTEKLAVAMRKLGHKCTPRLVAKGLRKLGYSLQALAKTFEGRTHVDRDAQFAYINTQMNAHISAGQPVLSVDTKKKELVGLFQNGGREYQKKACQIPVNAYDFPNLAEYKAAPYGIYNFVKNKGFVNVGVSHDTPEFAAASIRAWLETSGKQDTVRRLVEFV